DRTSWASLAAAAIQWLVAESMRDYPSARLARAPGKKAAEALRSVVDSRRHSEIRHWPAAREGDRTTCLARDCDVIITGWSAARISWPRCRAFGTRGGGSGLLVDEELARAVRRESAAAIRYWWGVTVAVVWRWRKALGVDRCNNEGSQRLVHAAAELGGEASRERGTTPAERRQRRKRALQLNLARNLKLGYHGPWWTAEEL